MKNYVKKIQARQAFSLVELVLVLVIIILLTGLASLPVVRIIERARVESDAGKLEIFLKKSVQHAVMKGTNVQILLDIDNGIFEAYEIYQPKDFSSDKTDNKNRILDETPILGSEFKPLDTTPEDTRETEFLFECEPMELNFLDTVLTEDGQQNTSGELYFEADSGGWLESFIVTITDQTDTYSSWLRCERATATVRKYKNETELPQPVESF